MNAIEACAWIAVLCSPYAAFRIRRWALLSDAREAVSAAATVVWLCQRHEDYAEPGDMAVALKIAADADARMRDIEGASVWRWSP